MSKLLVGVVLVCACCSDASGQGAAALFESSNPPLLTATGCVVASDMLIVARAMAAERVDRATADRAMALIYVPWADGGLNDALRSQLTDIAYRSVKPPITLSMAFLVHCRMLRGQRREG